MIRAALAALLLALLLASGAAVAAPAPTEAPPDRIEATSRSSARRKPASPPLNTFEIVVAVLGLGAGVGGYLFISRRPSRGCGSSGFG